MVCRVQNGLINGISKDFPLLPFFSFISQEFAQMLKEIIDWSLVEFMATKSQNMFDNRKSSNCIEKALKKSFFWKIVEFWTRKFRTCSETVKTRFEMKKRKMLKNSKFWRKIKSLFNFGLEISVNLFLTENAKRKLQF